MVKTFYHCTRNSTFTAASHTSNLMQHSVNQYIAVGKAVVGILFMLAFRSL